VHLPIGILLIAVIFQFLSAKEKYTTLQSAVRITLLLGMISAIASCISGYLLSQADDYDATLVGRHQWLGISVAVISIIAYFLHQKNNKQLTWVMGVMGLLIIITGHLGGSLTHGSDYLTKSFSSQSVAKARKPIPNVQEAIVYTDVIKPILKTRCYSCHGPNKQKGKLRLDAPDFITKGGKEGEIIVPGKPDESELIKRILLPLEDEDHMPLKEKPQLSKQDIELINCWVSRGADYTKKVKELPQPDKIKPLLLALQSGEVKEEIKLSDIPEKPVEKATDSIIQKLKARGVAVIPVAVNSNYLAANFIAVDSITMQDMQLLSLLSKQLIWLKLGNTKINDSIFKPVSLLTVLTRLYLENTAITDKGLQALKNLVQLQYLNLTGTFVTAYGILQLKELKKINQIYLYKTSITVADFTLLKNTFPLTLIDTGGYRTAMLASDTEFVKPPLGNK
jgi:uncharacterized membrane protein